MRFCKYSGAGNVFVVMDGRGEQVQKFRNKGTVTLLCDEFSAEGLIILTESREADFRMEFFNPDGTTGMMCGNGGRCIAAFASSLGIRPSGGGGSYVFEAPDGMHEAHILSSDGATDLIRLSMSDIEGVRYFEELEEAPVDGWLLDTGAPHFVVFDENVREINVNAAGKVIRSCKEFAPGGVNVDFVSEGDGIISVRTFERGVEAETAACGTGVVACAAAAYSNGIAPSGRDGDELYYEVETPGSRLEVRFVPEGKRFTRVSLTGPATFVTCI